MSKIFHAESNVAFQNVRFADLESACSKKDGFFVPLDMIPASGNEKQSEPASDKSHEGPEPKASKAKDDSSGPAKPGQKQSDNEKNPGPDTEALKKEAYTRGKKEGRAEAEKKLHSTTQALAEALEQISQLRTSLLENSKDDMIRLIMAAAGKVIRTGAQDYRDMVADTVTGALEAAVEADEYYIRVNPEDLETVKEREPLFLAAMKGLQNIYFISDEKISRGGCMAESRAGDVDATIETQLIEIEDHLRKAMV